MFYKYSLFYIKNISYTIGFGFYSFDFTKAVGNTVKCLEELSQCGWNLFLETYIFTKLPQTEYLINAHILMCLKKIPIWSDIRPNSACLFRS